MTDKELLELWAQLGGVDYDNPTIETLKKENQVLYQIVNYFLKQDRIRASFDDDCN